MILIITPDVLEPGILGKFLLICLFSPVLSTFPGNIFNENFKFPKIFFPCFSPVNSPKSGLWSPPRTPCDLRP
jgi:hypothetical protein